MPELPLLRQFRDEIRLLVDSVIHSTARVEVMSATLEGGSGSAWLFDEGLWVTNEHVVRGAGRECTLTNLDQRLHAEVVGYDEYTDLAVLRTEPVATGKPLPVRRAPVGLGETCFAFGAPKGWYKDSVTMGIVSGLGRPWHLPTKQVVEWMVQYDAATTGGNSGGPVVDVFGEVIGVCQGGYRDADNMSFAVPADIVRRVAPEIVQHGEVVRSSLGVGVEVFTSAAYVEELRVVRAPDGSPLQVGDIIVSVAGTRINRRSDLFLVMDRSLVDQQVEVELRRDDQVLKVLASAQQRQPLR